MILFSVCVCVYYCEQQQNNKSSVFNFVDF
jgi:hypothetical protein